MRRWTYDPPDTDQYEAKPTEDVDVPDFSEPDVPVDPAEHDLSNILASLSRLEQEIEKTPDFNRLMLLWKMAREAETHAADIVNLAARTVDQILERRR